MKRFVVYMLLFFPCLASLGQQAGKPQAYYFIGEDQLYKWRFSADTIGVYRCDGYSTHAEATPESLYKILETGSRDSFRVYYVEELVHFSNPVAVASRFKPVLVKYTANGQVAGVLVEADGYASVAACKQHLPLKPNAMFLLTCYSEQKLQSFAPYMRIANLDSMAVDKLLLSVQHEMKTNKERLAVTHMADLYGSLTARELMNRAMIRQKINPLVPGSVITKKAKNSPVAKQMGGTL